MFLFIQVNEVNCNNFKVTSRIYLQKKIIVGVKSVLLKAKTCALKPSRTEL